MMRAMPGIAFVVAGLLLTVGCTSGEASSNGPAPSTDGIGPITFAIGKDNPGWLQGVITGWNQQNPSQKVTLLLLPEASNDQLAQLVANLQAKSDEYDVIDMDVIWTAEFASNGWIIPLPRGQFPLGHFLEPAVDTAMYQGRLYAVPDYSNADLLYYRKDILAKAGKQPPKTWAQLQQLAETVAPKYGLYGYAGTFAPYEGLTVNFAEAVQSAGGSILSPEGTRVTVDSAKALQGLEFLVNGFQQGWIPKVTLTYEEESAQNAFEAGKFLFLDNWPDVYAALSVPGPQNKVPGDQRVLPAPANGAELHQVHDGPDQRAADAGAGVVPPGLDPALYRQEPDQQLSLPARARAGHQFGPAAPGDHQLRPGQPGHLEHGLRGPDTPEEPAAGPNGIGRAADPDHPRRMRRGADRTGVGQPCAADQTRRPGRIRKAHDRRTARRLTASSTT
jgi:ABC-type glycerol-3-phosphate transport system substrate-binding protein